VLQNCYLDSLAGVNVSDLKAVVYGIPGSGSTYVWQLVAAVLHDGVVKTHSYLDVPKTVPVVITIRDMRAALVSNHRMLFGDTPLPDHPELVRRCCDYAKHCYLADVLTDDYTSHTLWYESFVEHPDIIFDAVEQTWGAVTNSQERDRLRTKFSFRANRERSAIVTGDYDRETLLHRNHLHSGTNASCREYAGEYIWADLTHLLRRQLSQHSYA